MVREIETAVNSFEDERRKLRNPLLTMQPSSPTQSEKEEENKSAPGIGGMMKGGIMGGLLSQMEKVEQDASKIEEFIAVNSDRLIKEMNFVPRTAQSIRDKRTE